MDVLLFTDVNEALGFGRYAGAYRIATELRDNNFSTQVVDMFASLSDSEIQRILHKFITNETLFVGFSSTLFVSKGEIALETNNPFPFSLSKMNEIFTTIKQINPDTKIVVGGAKATFTEIEGVDYFIWGEGENSVVSLANHLKSNTTIITYKTTHGQKISSTDYPYECFNKSKIKWSTQDAIFTGEHLPIEISRGCRFRCAFCSFNLNGKKPSDYIKDPSIVRDEMIYNYDNFQTQGYMFADDTYNDSIEKVTSYHDMLSTLPFDVKWSTYARIDMIYRYPEMAKLMLESGLQSVFFGLESFNHETAKIVGKGLDPNKVKDTLYMVKDVWGDKVSITSSFIVGLPHESIDSILDTVEWLSSKDCPIDNVKMIPLTIKKRKKSQFNISDIGMNYEEYGYDIDDNGVWKNEHMSLPKAKKLVNEFHSDPLKEKQGLSGYMFLSRLQNLGYSFEEANSTSYTKDDVDKKFVKLKQQYVDNLLK